MASTESPAATPAATEPATAVIPAAPAGAVEVTCDHAGFAPGIGVMLQEGKGSYSPADAAQLINAGMGKASKPVLARLKALNLITDSKE